MAAGKLDILGEDHYSAIITTSCCALSQLVARDDSRPEVLNDIVERHAARVLKGGELGPEGGAPTLFCITTPDEPHLQQYLLEHDWKPEIFLARRVGYPEGNLIMFLKRFAKEAQQ